MAQFPTTLPNADDIAVGQTLAQAGHTVRHNVDRDEIRAIAEKVGVDASSDPNSLDNKVTDLRNDLTDTQADVADVITDVEGMLARVYPVGCIYTTTTSANPATTFGFGTWVAFGAGRVPVGYDASQTEFDTVEETGGEKAVTLTAAQIPAHTHGLAAGEIVGSAGGGSSFSVQGGTSFGFKGNSTTASGGGSGGSHNNLQPYIVVRMWKRTA